MKTEFTKEEIDNLFANNSVLRVVFTKKDGSLREMVCTKDLSVVPIESHPKGGGSRVPPVETCNVYEIDNGWRSFSYAAVKSIEVVDNE
jgi:hypothetical protein